MQVGSAVVKEGHVLLVSNEARSTHSDKYYYQIWVEIKKEIATWLTEDDKNGNGELPLLFTDFEIKRAYNRALKNKKSVIKKNKLIDLID